MFTLKDTQFESVEDSVPVEFSRPTYEDIEALAYAMWEARGGPEGSADEDWLRAERELSGSRG